MELKSGEFKVPFGIVNIAGLMESSENVVSNPVFSHESYTIRTTLDSSLSPELGTIISETSENGKNYKKYFRKNVRWDFGDGTETDGQFATHSYKFPGRYTITCYFFDIDRKGYKNGYSLDVIVKQAIPSKIEFVKSESSVESIPCSSTEKIARLDVTLSNLVSMNLNIKAQRIFENGETVRPNWEDVKELEKPQFQSYYTFLTIDDILQPCTKYKIDYETIYGRFFVQGGLLDIELYRVTPFKNAEKLPDIYINDPNVSILISEKEPTISVPIHNVSTVSEVPEGCTPIGKRGFVDILYRSDFISSNDKLMFSFDIDNYNITDTSIPSKNFLNIQPLGLNLSVVGNENKTVRYSLTFNGFCNNYRDVDEDIEKSFIKNYCFSCYLTPYIKNELCGYYIPKDYDLYDMGCSVIYRGDNDSLVKITKNNIYQFLLNVRFELHSILEAEISMSDFKLYLYRTLQDMSNIVLPREHMYEQDLDDLIKSYFPHTVFNDKTEFKQMIKNLLGNNNFLNYIVTRGVNFVDDFSNPHTIYTSQLLNLLKMMGQNVSEYEVTNFDGVNELRDLCRILSMNFSRVFGHKIKDKNGIRVTEFEHGYNVGDRIFVTDKLYVYVDNHGRDLLRGKIFKIERDGEILDIDYPTVLIVSDDYAHSSRTVSFSGIAPVEEVQQDEEGRTFTVFCIANYDRSWRWNLLLPDNYNTEKQGEIINSYYSFYLFKESDETTRIGNYADEKNITSEMEQLDNWDADSGLAEKLLLSVVLDGSESLLPENNEITELPTPPSELEKDNEIHFVIKLTDNLTISLVCPMTVWNLKTSNYVDCLLNWGDGSPDVRISERVLSESTDILRHTYKKRGTYTIAIKKGVFRWWLPENNKLSGEDGVFQSVLTNIIIPDGKFSPMVQVDGGFSNCPQLENIPANLFAKISTSPGNENNVRYAFAKNPKLKEIPAGLLGVTGSYFGPNVDFTGMFSNSETFTVIPDGFLDGVAKEKPQDGKERHFIFNEMFNLCTHLLFAPENLLDGFDDNGEISITRMFRGSSSLNFLPPAWERFGNNTPHANCFCACYSAKNYSQLPDGWGCI